MHMVGCFWNWLSIPPLHDPSEADALPTWVDATPDLKEMQDDARETSRDATAQAPFGHLYTASMLWALTTMSTIGYGDIKAIGNGEKLYSNPHPHPHPNPHPHPHPHPHPNQARSSTR